MQSELYLLSKRYVAPALVSYVSWVLQEAQDRGISRLYFLARDGFILMKIAQLYCQEWSIPIECKYLFCSRASFRMPTYHLIGDEAYELLFLGGYHVTINTFFERAGIPSKMREIILQESGLSVQEDMTKLLSKMEVLEISKKLRNSPTYIDCVQQNSRQSYSNTIGYLRQEQLFDQHTVAIVDSGWTGSMQRSLRQLLESDGFSGKMLGFYFGMYALPLEPKDGEYLTWHFSKKSSKRDKILFNNNLFECILSAPHGMTIGYTKCADRYEALLCPSPQSAQLQRIQEQINGIMDEAKAALTDCLQSGKSYKYFSEKKQKRQSLILLRHLMAWPTIEEVKVYGSFLFCDDITENYHFSLAEMKQLQKLKNYSLIPRLMCKLFGKKGKTPFEELFWPFGTVALLPSRILRVWYRVNIYVWEWLRYTLK